MRCSANYSRRTLLQVALGALGATLGRASNPFQSVSAILRGFSRDAVFGRRYRVDATVLLLGLPLVSRLRVGGAYASVETASVASDSAVALQFAAGSWPARSKGLNRFGIWREAVVMRHGEPVEIAFAGLMTDSHEHTLSEAQLALSGGKVAEAIVARGYAHGGTMKTWIYRFLLGANRTWTDSPGILFDATRNDPSDAPRENSANDCGTFLHAVRCAALDQQNERRQWFAHAGKLHQLETHRDPEQPLMIHAAIRDLSGARSSEFRATFAAGDQSGLPLRIEFRAKSFLRLTLVCEPDANQPPIPSVFEESA